MLLEESVNDHLRLKALAHQKRSPRAFVQGQEKLARTQVADPENQDSHAQTRQDTQMETQTIARDELLKQFGFQDMAEVRDRLMYYPNPE